MGDSKACDDDFLQKQLLENSLNLIKIQERMIQNLCAENEILKKEKENNREKNKIRVARFREKKKNQHQQERQQQQQEQQQQQKNAKIRKK